MRMLNTLLLSVFLAAAAWCQEPVIFGGGTVNGVNYAPGMPIAPGSIASIFGSNLAASLAQADSVPLSSNLNNVSVTINGIPAPLYFVSPGQVNVQVPWNVLPQDVNTGTVNVVVSRGQVASNAEPVQIAPVSPAIFALGPDGAGNAIAVNPDGTIAAPPGSIPGLVSHPATADEAILILASGLGAVNSPPANGANSLDQLRTTVDTPTVLIGGQASQLLFSGLSPSFTGVYQVNAVVPAGSIGRAVPLQIMIGGIITTDQVTIAIQ